MLNILPGGLDDLRRSMTCLSLLFFSCFAVADPVSLSLLDNQTDQPVQFQSVTAKLIQPDGSLTWAQRKTTDEAGLAQFDLPFDNNQQYLFEARVFNSFNARFGPLSSADSISYRVGKTQIQLRDGTHQDKPAFANQRVQLKQIQSDGTFKTIANVTTDDEGLLKLDLSDDSYILAARSLLSGRYHSLPQFTGTQSQQFEVGELPLTINLTHAATGQPIANQQILAKRITDSGLKWYGKKTTDENGQIVWEMENLNQGQAFQFSTRYFGNFDSKSRSVNASGNFDWGIGSIQVAVKDGSAETPTLLSQHDVKLQRIDGDNARTISSLKSDNAGMLYFDLPELSDGQVFRLESRSAVDGQTRYYYSVNKAGSHDFTVGSKPLSITVRHAQTNNILADVQVTLREVLADNKTKWLSRKTSDSEGKIAFDLPGLGTIQKVQLSAKVFHNSTSYSQIIQQAGDFSFALGSVQVKLLDGTKGGSDVALPPLANHSMDFLRIKDGKLRVVKRITSDENGLVLVDLPDLSEATPYTLKSRSPLDSRSTYQQSLDQQGSVDFVVGSMPLNVNLAHARTNQALADQRVTLTKKNSEGQFKYVGSKTTDESGNAVFDVQDFDGESLFRVESKVFSNFVVRSDPFSQAQNIQLSFGKLQVEVKDGNQGDQPPLVDYSVGIKTYNQATGKSKWYAGAKTDNTGVLQLDLPEPPAGEQYILYAKSKTDNKHKYSDPIDTQGDAEFVVGNLATTVTVNDLFSQATVVDLRVTAERKNDVGEWKWANSGKTDVNGQVVFDLDGIASGSEYRFRAAKYRGTVYSDTVTAPGDINLSLGAVPVVLTNKSTLAALSGIKITAYRFEPDGNLQYEVNGTTDSSGQVVFDLKQLGESRYIFKAHRPFPDIRQIFSRVITSQGPLDFSVSEDDDTSIDTQAPQIAIVAPLGDEVVTQGFVLAGNVSDDKQLASIEIAITDNSGVENRFSLEDVSEGEWQASIPGDLLNVDSMVTATATAFDRMGNSSSTSKSFRVVEDTTPPELIISSHQNNDIVNVTGFTLSGTVTDDIQVQSLSASLVDGELGTVFTERPVTIDPVTGQWALYVGMGQVAENSTLAFNFTAQDATGNQSLLNLTLTAEEVDLSVRHLLQRATFGLKPGLEDQVTLLGVQAWLDQQLSPENIDDSAVEAMVNQININDIGDLRQRELLYLIYSERQLQQVMGWFWENHFSTNYRSHDNIGYEAAENQQFRQLALGNFRDLLDASAKSPAMLLYLNNDQSVKGRPNENYPREVMELHSMGEDGGYTSEDIAELARILTGWQVGSNGQFAFNADDHDTESKVFLGQEILPGGVEEGEQALDILSQHPSTASFLCSKLVHFWVSDQPQARLNTDCANAFSNSNGDIPTVLRAIFNSTEFNDGDNFASKIKTPLELYVSTVRSLSAQPDIDQGLDIIDSMGMGLFDNPSPDGYPDSGPDWINVDAMMQRSRFAARLAFNDIGAEVDLINHLQERDIRTSDAVVGYLFSLLLSSTTGDQERLQAIAILDENQAFSLDANDAELKLQRLLATVLSYPGFQYQ